MASTSSSRITAGAHSYSYDVFLSFRGEDTRNSFTDHLYHELLRAAILPFRDNDDIGRGHELKPEIEKAIRESRASIVVLSENYATSTWCLDELDLILEQRRECNHYVLPVFYHVDPSDVRKQNQTFKIEVNNSSTSRWTDENVSRWKAALTKVAGLKGHHVYPGSGPETETLKEIGNDVYKNTCHGVISLPPDIVGLDTRKEDINIWIRKIKSEFLEICGMGGSGKTTLAQHIYDSNWKSFEGASFVEGIGRRITEEKQSLSELRLKLLEDIFGDMKKLLSASRGTCKIVEVLQKKKVLIVLDDITSYDHIEYLLGTGNINEQSKIIITTREGNTTWFELKCWRCQRYVLELLNKDESIKLLRHHALNTNTPMACFEGLEMKAVQYCAGNPLALKVLGSSLSSEYTISHWESQLRVLENDINVEIQHVLKRSYESLPHNNEKELFLHIACFFVGKDMDYVAKILDCDYSAKSGIKTLIDRCLVSVLPNKKLMMHQLIQEMGRQIVREESLRQPKKRTRVWDYWEAEKILRRGTGSEAMIGLSVKKEIPDNFVIFSETSHKRYSARFNTDSLRKICNLKLLELHWVELTGSYDEFLEDLRWICWHGSNLRTIPVNLFMRNLIALDMSCSMLGIFEPPEDLPLLKILNLKDSKVLSEIRNIYRLRNLDSLILWNCVNLDHICETIVSLKNLALLNMTGCKNACKEKKIDGLVGKSSSSSSRVAKPLQYYNRRHGRLLTLSLPHSIEQLFLNNCDLECTDSFPLSFSDQPHLQYLNLSSSLFSHLPYYDHLQNLRVLDLSFCPRLKRLLRLPSTLAELYIYKCVLLEKVTFESQRFTLQELGYAGCTKLSEIEGFIKLVPVARLDEVDLGHLKWLKNYQYLEVPLAGDNELIIDRSIRLQMLYEFGIISTSLPDIEDPNLVPEHKSGSIGSSSLCFNIPPCPPNKRLKGLNVTFKYIISDVDDDCVWFVKIQTTNAVNLMYNPKVFGKPGIGIWLSYWPIGNELDVGDEVNVSIITLREFPWVIECGVSLVYNDDEVVDQTLGRNMRWAETLGGDLSGFQLSTGAYYLCRRDFFELVEVGGLTSDWFRLLVGDTIDDEEVRGWRKTGRPKQLNTSFTHLQTIGCILYNHGQDVDEYIEQLHIADEYFESRENQVRTIGPSFDTYTSQTRWPKN